MLAKIVPKIQVLVGKTRLSRNLPKEAALVTISCTHPCPVANTLIVKFPYVVVA